MLLGDLLLLMGPGWIRNVQLRLGFPDQLRWLSSTSSWVDMELGAWKMHATHE